LDARYAGLQFVIPDVYGYDIQPGTGALAEPRAPPSTTIASMGGGMQVGLFNDTWAWGEAVGGPLHEPRAEPLRHRGRSAAHLLPSSGSRSSRGSRNLNWYTVNGAPLIYFYNAGTLLPTSGSERRHRSAEAALHGRLRGRRPSSTSTAGTEPSHRAPTRSSPGTPSRSFPSTNLDTDGDHDRRNLTFDNAMVKWDSLGRDIAGGHRRFKRNADRSRDPTILDTVLQASANANVLLLATWNDLGEGTGITRNYDYYYQGAVDAPGRVH
jgi:hypothetical protein